MNNLFDNFNGIFGRIENGMCRLTMNGQIAIQTSNGYKSYNIKTKKLTNCTHFCFNIGEEFFFVIPTNKVEVGDIILVNQHPNCVTKVDDNQITVINYENSTIETVVPERHVFMGNTYFYGKIVSMFGNNFIGKKDTGNKMLQYMMMSEMLKNMNGNENNSNQMSNIFPIMMMFGGNMKDMFSGMFNFFDNTTGTENDSTDTEAD